MSVDARKKDFEHIELCTASPDEVGLFYSQEEQNQALATVGHMRFDHGHGGKELRAELDYRSTTGFRYELLSDGPDTP